MKCRNCDKIPSHFLCSRHLDQELIDLKKDFTSKYPELTDLKISYRPKISYDGRRSYEIIGKCGSEKQQYLAFEYLEMPVSEMVFIGFILFMCYVIFLVLLTTKSYKITKDVIEHYWHDYKYPSNVDRYYFRFERV